MTRDERIRAYTMREDGFSLYEIGQELGYSESAISSALIQTIRKGVKNLNIIYPTLRNAVQKYGTIQAFSLACGVSPSTSYAVLSGRTAPSQEFKDAVCRELGIPEREAFDK